MITIYLSTADAVTETPEIVTDQPTPNTGYLVIQIDNFKTKARQSFIKGRVKYDLQQRRGQLFVPS
jgi:hypothetical protein